MASHPEFPPDGRKSPAGHRRVPHSLTTSFFAKSRKGGDSKSASLQSPTITTSAPPLRTSPIDISIPSATRAAGAASTTTGTHGIRTEPIAIPAAAMQTSSSHKQKKLAPSSTFNTHYRSISRSMNDLGNIFSRGRSPPNRDVSPLRPGGALAQDVRRKTPLEPAHPKNFEPGNVPSISVVQHGESSSPSSLHIAREGWLNVIDSHIKKSASLRDSWKLHYAMIIEGHMLLYKSPSSFQIRAFELGAVPPSPQRPQSAPAITSPTHNASTLRHKSTARHPELILSEDRTVRAGTVEALCHELVFTTDPTFVYLATRLLSGWTGPETALSVLLELSTLQDSSSRIGDVLQVLAAKTPGLLLDSDCYNCARLLAEKGIGPHNQEIAKASRMAIEKARAHLQEALDLAAMDESMIGLPFPLPLPLPLPAFSDHLLQGLRLHFLTVSPVSPSRSWPRTSCASIPTSLLLRCTYSISSISVLGVRQMTFPSCFCPRICHLPATAIR